MTPAILKMLGIDENDLKGAVGAFESMKLAPEMMTKLIDQQAIIIENQVNLTAEIAAIKNILEAGKNGGRTKSH